MQPLASSGSLPLHFAFFSIIYYPLLSCAPMSPRPTCFVLFSSMFFFLLFTCSFVFHLVVSSCFFVSLFLCIYLAFFSPSPSLPSLLHLILKSERK